MTKLVNIRVFL